MTVVRTWAPMMVLCLVCGGAALATENIVIAGAGPSTAVATHFFEAFAKLPAAAGYSFTVPPRSIKHAGGLKATERNLFGRTGRPLTPQEKGDTRAEIFLARIPLTFVIDPDLGISALDRDQLLRILKGEITSWQQVGGPDQPVILVGREPSEAALLALSEPLPEIADAPFVKRLRKDHQLVQMMDTPDRRGVLGFGARSNFSDDLCLDVEDLDVGLAVGLVYDLANKEHELVQEVQKFAASEAWKKLVIELGMLPV